MKKMDDFNWTPIREKIYKQLKAGKDVVSVMKSVPCTESAVYLVNAAMKQGFLPREEIERFSPVNNLLNQIEKEKEPKPLRPPESAEPVCICGHKMEEHRTVGCMHILGNDRYCPCTKPNESKPPTKDPFGGNLTRRTVQGEESATHELLNALLLASADRAALEFEIAKIKNETARLNTESGHRSWEEHIIETARVHAAAGHRSWTEHVASELTISEIVEILMKKLGLWTA